MNTSKIVSVNLPNFEKIINQGIVLVDFWAEWCEPCKVQDPILMDVAEETTGEVIIAKLNIDDNRFITQQFGVKNIPSMILFKEGKEVQRWSGLQSKDVLISGINKY